MIYVVNEHTDAGFNAAAEQYLLHNFDDNIFMLWRNKRAVVLGKHQVAYGEVNYPYVKENDVQVIRRITGGGTVYHDLGNINFTFIEKVDEQGKMIDFNRYLLPMQKALAALGIKVQITPTNDLTLNGKKISGNAEHVFQQQKKVIHHGTILFNSNISQLGVAIRPGTAEYHSKAVNSNRTTVTSICEELNVNMDIIEFIEVLKKEILTENSYIDYQWSSNDIQAIKEIKSEKFDHWHWNYGYSPKYKMIKKNLFDVEALDLELEVKNGIILSAIIEFQNTKRELVSIVGRKHEEVEIKALENHIVNEIGIRPELFRVNDFFY